MELSSDCKVVEHDQKQLETKEQVMEDKGLTDKSKGLSIHRSSSARSSHS